ncbi:uncharacterized protein KLLA0_E13927g [Kluyveromyces lactis]|uniref:KLLA0E13927p n=1 Tax=Kluyveromyces lactis (strain ATCC 8585 / CBS 2359 / DSM 70799 / NBRC 1267 / NRRL Y-1140 / WM37) TaxID=284590 RepID=Q6CNB0_KLULA|nr:uncharacterized protein KLLA0_E13927g [Kluyveromyces lactis]CAG99666.1 KLLA0E13927p [Kluyveromyces lactis]|eukprot:XP_454579.1 uncharacterized protein KLLA0_E13927g [Kluyveromyces lactis]
MIWTYEMDLALCKLVYLNSPEILIDGVRDRTKNYHSVLSDFNKQFRLQVKQARTVRARFERLLLDYKSRAQTKFAPTGRESEIDMLMKTLVNMEIEYHETHKITSVPPGDENINAMTTGDMVEKAIDALKEVPNQTIVNNMQKMGQPGPKLIDVTGNQNLPALSSNGYNGKQLPSVQVDGTLMGSNTEGRNGTRDKTGQNIDKNPSGNANYTHGNQSDLEENNDGQGINYPNIDTELQPPAKKFKHNIVPESQPFTITNYFSDNKTFIMNGDGGTQHVSGKSDLKEVTQRVQTDLEHLKQDVGELSTLSKQIAKVLKRVTSMEETAQDERGY